MRAVWEQETRDGAGAHDEGIKSDLSERICKSWMLIKIGLYVIEIQRMLLELWAGLLYIRYTEIGY